jgi:WhiB family transcriptional regulator, redox-sensing transcriptional regulator
VTEVIIPSGPALILALYDEDSLSALSWQDKARCAEVDPERWFPEKGGSVREAKRVCRSCEVRPECLDYALEHGERFGIWGGMSERERRRLTSERTATQARQPREAAA